MQDLNNREMSDNQKELRRIMAYHGLRAADVAKMLHRTPVTVRRYMCGSSKISNFFLDVVRQRIERNKDEIVSQRGI